MKSIYAETLKLALFNREIYHQYKLTPSVLNGKSEITCQIKKKAVWHL